MALNALRYLALVLTAVALVPAGAHLFELPNKIDLSQEQYYTVQAIYRGWALFGIVLFGSLTANLALTVGLRRRGVPFGQPFAASLCLAAGLAIFFTWTYPANLATANWAVPHPDWRELRRQWEYAHAANAILTFIALCCLFTVPKVAAGKRGDTE